MDEFARVMNSSEVQKKLKEFEPFLESLRLAVGKKALINLNDILLLHNNLDIESRMGLKMEPWMLQVLADERLRKMRMLYYEIHGYNARLRRLNTGTR